MLEQTANIHFAQRVQWGRGRVIIIKSEKYLSMTKKKWKKERNMANQQYFNNILKYFLNAQKNAIFKWGLLNYFDFVPVKCRVFITKTKRLYRNAFYFDLWEMHINHLINE